MSTAIRRSPFLEASAALVLRQFNHSSYSDGSLFIFMSGFPTGDLHPIYIAPMLGTHNKGFRLTTVIKNQMAWIYLIIAGILEIGWPIGIKISQNPATRILGIFAAIVFMGCSGFFLWLAQRVIPLGTAYAIWTGIGASGTFLLGILIFNDPATLLRYFGVFLIIAGVVTLKLAH